MGYYDHPPINGVYVWQSMCAVFATEARLTKNKINNSEDLLRYYLSIQARRKGKKKYLKACQSDVEYAKEMADEIFRIRKHLPFKKKKVVKNTYKPLDFRTIDLNNLDALIDEVVDK